MSPPPLPQSARDGHEIPGYTGHIPGLKPENVYGKTFRAGNSHAALGRQAAEPLPVPLVRTASAPAELTPGYMGHMPGKSENVFGKGWQHSKALQLSHLDPYGHRRPEYEVSSILQPPSGHALVGRAGSEIPGYTGYIPGVRPESLIMGSSIRNINDRAHSARGLEPTRRPSGYVPPEPPLDPPRKERKHPVNVVPGYMGHMPGGSENVFGKTHLEAHLDQQATLGILPRQRNEDPRTPRAPSLPPELDSFRAGRMAAISVPGYKGHIPGKVANNVVGKTFAAANLKSTRDKFAPGWDPYANLSYNPISTNIPHRRSASASPGPGSRTSGVRTVPGEVLRAPSNESIASTRSSIASGPQHQHHHHHNALAHQQHHTNHYDRPRTGAVTPRPRVREPASQHGGNLTARSVASSRGSGSLRSTGSMNATLKVGVAATPRKA